MKKLILFIILVFTFLLGKNNEYLDYTNKIIYYGFGLENFNKIKPPFESKNNFIVKTPKITILKRKNKKLKLLEIKLLSIFNNQAFLLIKEYINNNLKMDKRWVKINDKIANCKVLKIKLVKVILKCNNKIIIKTLDNNLLKIKGIK